MRLQALLILCTTACGHTANDYYVQAAIASVQGDVARHARDYAGAQQHYEAALAHAAELRENAPADPIAQQVWQGEMPLGRHTVTELNTTVLTRLSIEASASQDLRAAAFLVADTDGDLGMRAAYFSKIANWMVDDHLEWALLAIQDAEPYLRYANHGVTDFSLARVYARLGKGDKLRALQRRVDEKLLDQVLVAGLDAAIDGGHLGLAEALVREASLLPAMHSRAAELRKMWRAVAVAVAERDCNRGLELARTSAHLDPNEGLFHRLEAHAACLRTGAADKVEPEVQEELAAARNAHDPYKQVDGLTYMFEVFMAAGQTQQALELLTEALRDAETIQLPSAHLKALGWIVAEYYDSNNSALGQDALRRYRLAATLVPEPRERLAALVYAGEKAVAAGQLEEARKIATEIGRQLPQLTLDEKLVAVYTGVAQLYARLGGFEAQAQQLANEVGRQVVGSKASDSDAMRKFLTWLGRAHAAAAKPVAEKLLANANDFQKLWVAKALHAGGVLDTATAAVPNPESYKVSVLIEGVVAFALYQLERGDHDTASQAIERAMTMCEALDAGKWGSARSAVLAEALKAVWAAGQHARALGIAAKLESLSRMGALEYFVEHAVPLGADAQQALAALVRAATESP